MTYLSDYDTYGFKAAEIFPLLAKHGVTLHSPQDEGQDVRPQRVWQEWQNDLAMLRRLSIEEATFLLLGLEPRQDNGYWSDDFQNDYDRKRRVLTGAVASGDLAVEDTPEGEVMEAADFAAWCDRKDIERPLPWDFDHAIPSTDPELRRLVAEQRIELAKLQEKNKQLEATVAYWQQRKASDGERSQQLADAQAEIEALQASISELKDNNALSTRERETLYKIIIGLAVGVYKYNPEAKRNNVMAEMVADIERAGVSVTDDTLRKHLKLAAEYLPPKPA